MKKTTINATFEKKVQEMQDEDRSWESKLEARYKRKCNLMKNIIMIFQKAHIDVGEAADILDGTKEYMQTYANSDSVPLDVERRWPF